MTTTTQYFDQAIEKLEDYRESERDEDKANAAEAEIAGLLLAKQAHGFDDLANRSPALNQAVSALRHIADSAGDGPRIAESLNGINSLIAELQSVRDGLEEG